MAVQLDELDVQIIRCLQVNARRSNIEVARQLGVAEGTVRNRIQRLLREDVVRFVALVDPVKTGYETLAIVGITVEPAGLEAVAGALAAMPEVRYVSYALGDFDLLIEVLSAKPQALFDFLTKRLARVRGIRSLKTFITPRIVKRTYDWPPTPKSAANGPVLSGRRRGASPLSSMQAMDDHGGQA